MNIQLTQNQTAIVSEVDSDLNNVKWQYFSNDGYAKRKFAVNGKRVNKAMHRVVMERMLGRELIEGEVVDHINKNRLDNRRENLRLASVSENNANRVTKIGKSGFKGVTVKNSKFIVNISFRYQTYYVGSFETAEEAHKAYLENAHLIHGQFACTIGKVN